MQYNNRIFEKGQTYNIEDEVPGFIQRWINRGCKIIEDNQIVEEKKSDIISEDIAIKNIKRNKTSRIK
jgi:hypothetical protein